MIINLIDFKFLLENLIYCLNVRFTHTKRERGAETCECRARPKSGAGCFTQGSHVNNKDPNIWAISAIFHSPPIKRVLDQNWSSWDISWCQCSGWSFTNCATGPYSYFLTCLSYLPLPPRPSTLHTWKLLLFLLFHLITLISFF